MDVLRMTVGDKLRAVAITMVDEFGAPLNVNGQAIAFRMRNQDTGALTINNATASNDDLGDETTRGLVHYTFSDADVVTIRADKQPGTYAAWFIRTQAGGTEHFPGTGPDLEIVMVAD